VDNAGVATACLAVRQLEPYLSASAQIAAKILAGHLGLSVDIIAMALARTIEPRLAIALDEFEAVADEFFALPDVSVRRWERAIDAQRRIVSVVDARDRPLAGFQPLVA
jgi:hypothetical protein